MLDAAAITKTFGGKHVLGPLDLHLDVSERLAVTGPNGAGKSTLIRCIAGTLAPSTGEITVAGHRAGTLVFKRAEAVGALGIFGLVLVGGAFFPTQVLPHWVHPLAAVVPTRFAFSAARSALFGGSEWVSSTLVLAGWAVGFGAVSLVLFSVALRHAVRRGTLNQY